MSASEWFDDLPVIGQLSAAEAAARLQGVDDDAAQLLAEASTPETLTYGPKGLQWPFRDKLWQHTAHAFGYIDTEGEPDTEGLVSIRHAGSMDIADPSLANARVKITLDHLRVAGYPGRGEHHILFDFYAQNQVSGGDVEHLHFNATYRVREGERAPISGYPIFVGLGVGREGISLKCYTVNVKNKGDEAFLAFLDSDAFKTGLKLATTSNLSSLKNDRRRATGDRRKALSSPVIGQRSPVRLHQTEHFLKY